MYLFNSLPIVFIKNVVLKYGTNLKPRIPNIFLWHKNKIESSGYIDSSKSLFQFKEMWLYMRVSQLSVEAFYLLNDMNDL